MSNDPALGMIRAYEAGNQAYMDAPDHLSETPEAEAALIEATYGPAWRAMADLPPATTMDGAIAALEIALKEGCIGLGEPCIRSALAYLRTIA